MNIYKNGGWMARGIARFGVGGARELGTHLGIKN